MVSNTSKSERLRQTHRWQEAGLKPETIAEQLPRAQELFQRSWPLLCQMCPALREETMSAWAVGGWLVGDTSVHHRLLIHVPEMDHGKVITVSPRYGPSKAGLAVVTVGDLVHQPETLEWQTEVQMLGLELQGGAIPWEQPLPDDPVQIAKLINGLDWRPLAENIPEVLDQLTPEEVLETAFHWLNIFMTLPLAEHGEYSPYPQEQAAILRKHYSQYGRMVTVLERCCTHHSKPKTKSIDAMREQLQEVLTWAGSYLS